MNIILLNTNESFRKYLDPELIEIKQTHERGVVDQLEVTYPLSQNFIEDFEDWKPGNKIFINGYQGLKNCLYVITSKIDKDLWKNNNITVTLEEVLIELNYTPVVSQLDIPTKSVTLNRTNLETIFGNWYNIGVVSPPSKDSIVINGSMSRMELLRFIEEETGGVFTTQYEKEETSNRIKRTLNFTTVDEIGQERSSNPIDLGFNVENIVYSIDESECYNSVSPGLKYDEGANPNMTRANVSTLLQRFQDLEIDAGEQIPLFLNDEVTSGVYPLSDECNTSGTYWTRLPGDATFDWYVGNLEYEGTFGPSTTQMNQANTARNEGKFFSCNAAGTYSYWTGSSMDSSLSCVVGDIWICNGITWKLIRKENQSNVPKYAIAEAYWHAPLQKNTGELYLSTDYEELDYDHIYNRSDLDTWQEGIDSYIILNPEPDEEIEDMEFENEPEECYLQSNEKTGILETSEKDVYLIYNQLCWDISAKSIPDVVIDIDIKNFGEEYNLYDKIYVKIPTFNELIRCVISKTEKNPAVVGENKITVESFKEKSQIETVTNVELSVESLKVQPAKTFDFTGKLVETSYSIVDDEVVVDEEPIQNAPINIVITKPDSVKTTTYNYKYKGTYTDVYFDKYGITPYGQVCAIGKKTSSADTYAASQLVKGIFTNKCPICGQKHLFYSTGSKGKQAYDPYIGKWVNITDSHKDKGRIVCSDCGEVWSVEGNLLSGAKNKKLSKLKVAKSSTTERSKLLNGKLLYKAVKSSSLPKTVTKTVKVPGWVHTFNVKTNSSGVFKKAMYVGGLESGNYDVVTTYNGGKAGGKTTCTSIIQCPVEGKTKSSTLKASTYTPAKPHVPIKRSGSKMQSGVVSKEVQNKAKEIVGKKKGLTAVKAIADWVSKNIKYHGHNNFVKSPKSTLKSRKGNCCEHADLFAQLLEGADLLYAQDTSSGVKCRYVHVPGHVYNAISYKSGSSWKSIAVDTTKSSSPWGKVCSGYPKKTSGKTYPSLPFARNY